MEAEEMDRQYVPNVQRGRRDSDFLDWTVRRAAGTLGETSGSGRGRSRLQG